MARGYGDIHANMRFKDLIQHKYSQPISEGAGTHKIMDVPLQGYLQEDEGFEKEPNLRTYSVVG